MVRGAAFPVGEKDESFASALELDLAPRNWSARLRHSFNRRLLSRRRLRRGKRRASQQRPDIRPASRDIYEQPDIRRPDEWRSDDRRADDGRPDEWRPDIRQPNKRWSNDRQWRTDLMHACTKQQLGPDRFYGFLRPKPGRHRSLDGRARAPILQRWMRHHPRQRDFGSGVLHRASAAIGGLLHVELSIWLVRELFGSILHAGQRQPHHVALRCGCLRGHPHDRQPGAQLLPARLPLQ